MHIFGLSLATLLFCWLYLIENWPASASTTFPKYRISNKEIHLKHGKLHPHNDLKHVVDDDSDHVVYRYRWLEDDIVKSEKDFEGEQDDEYSDIDRKVKLPGGCELTEDQYSELESFKKETRYVKKCYCENGGVYCQINRSLLKHKVA